MRASPFVAAVVVFACIAAPAALAGGGPETTLVVVNGDSPVSKRVANDWVARRRIPLSHVVEIAGVPHLRVIDIETFRTKLWAPIQAFMAEHGLSDRIDLIEWSADFPYGVDFAADEPKPKDPPYTRYASLTAMTYFARAVEAKETTKWLPLDSNRYYRRSAGEVETRAPNDVERAAIDEAETAIQKKDYAGAAEAYRRVLSTYGEMHGHFYNYACCLARTGQVDEALVALEKAVRVGFSDADLARKDADLESLREQPRFLALLRSMEAGGATADVQPAHGFRSRSSWSGATDPVDVGAPDSLDRYYLSTMLAYTGEWGNSVPEALRALGTSIATDGGNPDGTFYFLVNGDVRATTRKARFAPTVTALEARGRKALLLEKDDSGQTGVLPIGKDDVLGGVLGVSDFDWAGSKSRILPGAIVEHLTSFGAVFGAPGQTKCTALIRAGAAGSSGTVNEPYALEAKFPVPAIHVHYVDGCSLAESFFQSVWGPYQLLVIGDGLARPFATFAKVTVGPDKWTGPGTVMVTAAIEPAKDRPIARVELWVDGTFVAEARPGDDIPLDTTKFDDGAHIVRAVAVEAGRIETRSFGESTFPFANGTRRVSIDGMGGLRPSTAYESSVAFAGRATESTEVALFAGARLLGKTRVSGGTWKLPVLASRLGVGTSVVHARATGAKGPASVSSAVSVIVDVPTLRKAMKSAGAKPGFVATAKTGEGKPVAIPLGNLGGGTFAPIRDAITAKAKGVVEQLVVEGEFDVAEAGAYQFLVNAGGTIALYVDGWAALSETKIARDRQTYAYASLAAGRHVLKIVLEPDGAPDLTVLLGGDRVTAPLESK